MNFIEILHNELDKYHLLKHPFYQAWSAGALSQDTLRLYAGQYYHHVAAFPRYISAIHSQCLDIKDRQSLLDNLNEEENGEENHPELWLRFAEGMGCMRSDLLNGEMREGTSSLVNGYFDLARNNFAKGLGALYAYERQTPEVAQSKIDGLQSFYGVTDARTLQFFTVHKEADVWHSEECAAIIRKFNDSQKEQVLQGAVSGAKLLWQFLDNMNGYDLPTIN